MKSKQQRDFCVARATTMSAFALRMLTISACAAPLALSTTAIASANTESSSDRYASAVFRDPTFEQLAAATVTSVARKEQSYFATSAAVYVISSDEIRRSGARSIPEALRLAPGVNVARLNSHRYAVSIRGFNSEFANKLLVLQDGRYLYTPLFAGVFWDMQDAPLDDVERIEVVRGPGGTAWGANAVNGVINIVTKSASTTQGWLATAGAGTEERGFGSLRYGGNFGAGNSFRIYASAFARDDDVFADGNDANDEARHVRGGFRLDSAMTERDVLTIHGESYDGSSKQITRNVPGKIDVDGSYLLGRWQHTFGANDRLTANFYYDSSDRQSAQGIADRNEWSLELVQQSRWGDRHDFTYGVHYRESENSFSPAPGLVFDPPIRVLTYASGFVDDAVDFFERRLTVSGGVKVEHNEFTGAEWLPNARVMWQPRTNYAFNHALWVAVSRGVRIPSISDNDQTVSIPGLLNLPNTELPSEKVTAYEIGWRMHNADLWTIDVSVFRNRYDDLRTRESMMVGPPLVLMRGSNMSGTTHGGELVVARHLAKQWRVQALLSYVDLNLNVASASTDVTSINDADGSSRWQAGLRSIYRWANWDFYLQFRHVAAISVIRVPSYDELDVNIAWQLTRNFEFSLVG